MRFFQGSNEGIDVIKSMDIFLDPFNVFIPPLCFQEFLNLLWSKAVFYNLSRGSNRDRIWRNVTGDKGFGTDNSAITNRNPFFYTDIISHPDIIANDHFIVCTLNGGVFYSNAL